MTDALWLLLAWGTTILGLIMVRKRYKRRWNGVDIPLTPLIDIVFLLLIYFLLTTNFISQEGITVKLPESKSSSQIEPQRIVVTVEKNGRLLLGDETVDSAHLFNRLKDLLERKAEPVVVIKADRDVPVKEAVKAMDIAKAAGAKRLLLATQKSVAR